jgi:soluble lytic murein transglycosylase-like protein
MMNSKKRQIIKNQLILVLILMIACIILLSIVIANAFTINKLRNEVPETVVETKVETLIVEKTVEVQPNVSYFDIPLSHEIQDVIFEECDKYAISPSLIIAMIERESRFNPDAIGDSGRSYGLMQIQKFYYQDTMIKLGGTDLINPVDNVRTGIYIISSLISRDNGIQWALMAYNGGEAYATRHLNNGTVSDYATSILARSIELECGRK